MPASSLWGGALESLEFLHRLGYRPYVSRRLARALGTGHLTLVQQLMGLQDALENRKYVRVAADHGNVVLLRWRLATGSPIDKASPTQIVTEYVEVAGYRLEGARVQLVCDFVTKRKRRKLLLWTLEKTRFNNGNSRATVYDAIQQAPDDTEQWLHENLTNA
jgi:hypothetical protein